MRSFDIPEVTNTRLQFGRCRLTVPDDVKLLFWNVPMPIKLYRTLQLQPGHEYTRFKALNTATCFGITLFSVLGHVIALHAHTAREPNATKVFNTIAPLDQPIAAWIYIPLPSGEEVQAFGLRRRYDEGESLARVYARPPSILVR